MNAVSLNITTEFVLIQCGQCGTPFYMEKVLNARRQADGETFYCPNGCGRVYRDGDAEKLRIERERSAALETRLASTSEQLRAAHAEREKTERSLSLLKQRTKNGVCPCCKRSFCNLRRHMQSKHPTYADKP